MFLTVVNAVAGRDVFTIADVTGTEQSSRYVLRQDLLQMNSGVFNLQAFSIQLLTRLRVVAVGHRAVVN